MGLFRGALRIREDSEGRPHGGRWQQAEEEPTVKKAVSSPPLEISKYPFIHLLCQHIGIKVQQLFECQTDKVPIVREFIF